MEDRFAWIRSLLLIWIDVQTSSIGENFVHREHHRARPAPLRYAVHGYAALGGCLHGLHAAHFACLPAFYVIRQELRFILRGGACERGART